MKKHLKLFAALFAMLVVLIAASSSVLAEGNYRGNITGSSVNVREKPDLSSKVLTKLSKGTVVSVTEDEGDWCKVTVNDLNGWVFKEYIKITEEIIGQGTIKGSNVNVRSEPDVASEKITQLDKGTKVDITRKAGNWYRILLGENKYGWVNGDYVIYRSIVASRGETGDKETAAAPASNTASDPEKTASSEPEKSASSGPDKVANDVENLRQQIVDYAKSFLGVKYVYGGASPKGFDCSGFVMYVFKNFDIKLDRSSKDQAKNGVKISKSELKPGDTVFFDTNGGKNGVNHVGIYIGDGKFIHASSGSSGRKVIISSITEGFYNTNYMWARRVIKE